MRWVALLLASLVLAAPAGLARPQGDGPIVTLALFGVDDGATYQPGAVVPSGQWMILETRWQRSDGAAMAGEDVWLDVRSGAGRTDYLFVTDAEGRARMMVPAAPSGPILATAEGAGAAATAAWAAGAPLANASQPVMLAPEDRYIEVEVELLQEAVTFLHVPGAAPRSAERENAAVYELTTYFEGGWSRTTVWGGGSRGSDVGASLSVAQTRVGHEADLPVAVYEEDGSFDVTVNGPAPAGPFMRLVLARAGLEQTDLFAPTFFAPPGTYVLRTLSEGDFHVAATHSEGSSVSAPGAGTDRRGAGGSSLHQGRLFAAAPVAEASFVMVSLSAFGGEFQLTRNGTQVPHAPPEQVFGKDHLVLLGQGACAGDWEASWDGGTPWRSRASVVLATGDPLPLDADFLRARAAPDCVFG